MNLKELDPGDIFIHAKSKHKKAERFIVYGNSLFNIRHGSPTRQCKKMNGESVSKSCRLEVIKTGESKHKEEILKKFRPISVNK